MIHVFVYGSLKRGFRNYHFLATSRFIGTGTTSCRPIENGPPIVHNIRSGTPPPLGASGSNA